MSTHTSTNNHSTVIATNTMDINTTQVRQGGQEPILTLHLSLPSSRMFLAARSRWINPFFERYFMPSAISRQN